MPAGPIGETWAPGSWADTTWQEGSWGDSGAAPVVDLRPQDASLLILRPRNTFVQLSKRNTFYRLPARNTFVSGVSVMMRVPVEPKTPDEEKDYGIKWQPWITTGLVAGVTISTSVWTVPPGLTNMAESISGLNTLVRVSGGSAGTTYELINDIVTSAGEVLQRAVEVRVMTPSDVLEL